MPIASTHRKHPSRLQFGFIAAGLNCFVAVMLYVVTLPPPLAPPVAAAIAPQPVVRQPIEGMPLRVRIPSLGIDLPVGTGSYDASTGTWTVDDSRAYYADMSVPPNDQGGTTLIYGHAQAPVFARLPQIKPGAQAIVTTTGGYTFRYRYESQRTVAPTDTSVLTATGLPSLTLQTCVGDWSAYRGLFSFQLEAVTRT